MDKSNTKFNLQARTTEFGIEIIRLCKILEKNIISQKIIDQLVRSGTSVGANYMEATNASSAKDFKNKLFICKKEAQETGYWLVMLKECISGKDAEIDKLSKECRELNLIFQKSINTIEEKLKLKKLLEH